MDRVYRRILSALLDDIVTARIAPGEWLPKVDDIAARHACGPNAAREAIRALEERRVVAVHAGKGQEVLPSDRWNLLDRDVAEATLLRGGDQRLLAEAVDYLRHAEIVAATLAVSSISDGDVAQMAQILDEMRAASRGGNGKPDYDDRFVAAETDFHRTLFLVTGNRFIASGLEQLHPIIATVRRQRAPDRDPSVIMLHARIVAALEQRDRSAVAAAADAYGRHLASWLRV
jgi:GntR family transcriptional repressor for pyruvate dehydrogenase complex